MRRAIVLALLAAGGAVVHAGGMFGQVSAGILSNTKDLETWTRYFDDTRETEMGLSLVPQGAGETLRLTFSARLPGRMPVDPAKEVLVHVSVGPKASPNVLRTPSLSFLADPGKPDQARIDLSARTRSDNPAPGAMINDLLALLRPEEFVRLARAENLRVQAFGFDLPLRPDQIQALRAFAKRVRLVPASADR
jgi:hypothetical protein